MKAFQIEISSSQTNSVTRTIEISNDCTVGREGTEILLADPRCSRKHANLEVTEEGIYVHDLGSRNGIVVNGRKVLSVFLCPGDAMTIGATVLRVAKANDQVVAHDWPGKWQCLPPQARDSFKGYFPE